MSIHYGAAYYPEVWPAEQIDADIKHMKTLHMNVVRMAEFAWSFLEPEEGVFAFDWLHQAIDRLHKEGIDVILGTPTAAPPVWLTTNYPEVLVVDETGVPTTHGGRQHCSHNSQVYRKFCRRIVDKMAQEFGEKPGVIAWQTDNELTSMSCHSQESQEAWHKWLETRYQDIGTLNEAWGTNVWSQRYQAFSQVPTGSKRVNHHPSLLVNWHRFLSDSACAFQAEQVEILRTHSDRPIMHNTMPGQKLDYYDLCADLDTPGLDVYHDYRHYWRVASNYDRMRGFGKGPHYLLETAPNYSGGKVAYDLHRPKGAVRAAVWMNHALGGQGSLFWLWRQHRSGQEMAHGAVLQAWGDPALNYDELCDLGKELQTCSRFLTDVPVAPAKAAIMYSHQSQVGLDVEPYITPGLNYYTEWSKRFYKVFQDAHIHRDVIGPDADIEPYNVLFIPLMPYIPEDMRRRLKPWVEQGNTLILGPMSGYRDREWTAFTDSALGDLESWMGIQVKSRIPLGSLPQEESPSELVWTNGEKSALSLWGDILYSQEGHILAAYLNTAAEFKPAIIDHRVENGRVIVLGTDPGTKGLRHILLDACAERQILPVVQGDTEVISVPRSNATKQGLVLVSISRHERKIRLPRAGRNLLTNRVRRGEVTLAPYEVLVLEGVESS